MDKQEKNIQLSAMRQSTPDTKLNYDLLSPWLRVNKPGVALIGEDGLPLVSSDNLMRLARLPLDRCVISERNPNFLRCIITLKSQARVSLGLVIKTDRRTGLVESVKVFHHDTVDLYDHLDRWLDFRACRSASALEIAYSLFTASQLLSANYAFLRLWEDYPTKVISASKSHTHSVNELPFRLSWLVHQKGATSKVMVTYKQFINGLVYLKTSRTDSLEMSREKQESRWLTTNNPNPDFSLYVRNLSPHQQRGFFKMEVLEQMSHGLGITLELLDI